MSKLYILNATQQRYNAFYRIPNVRAAQYADLLPGEQQCVYEGDAETIGLIVDQLQHYGLMDSAEYNRSLTAANRVRVHLLYRIDKPFSFSDQESVIRGRAIAQNENALNELKKETAALSAVEKEITRGKTAKKNQVEITAQPVHVLEGDQSLARSAADIAKFEIGKD